MGTKRVGLARTQALIQGLKRELTMGGAELSNAMLSNSKGVEMCVFSAPASADEDEGFGDSTGLAVPANSILTGLGCVVTTVLVATTGTPDWQCNFGLTAGAHDLTTHNVDSLQAGGGTVLVGKGTSTHSHETTAMGGGAALVFEANMGYSASARTVYGSITPSANDIDTGAAIFWVTYRLVA